MRDEYDVIVVGAGIGGLTTASILAKEGMRIALLEREDRVGGRAWERMSIPVKSAVSHGPIG